MASSQEDGPSSFNNNSSHNNKSSPAQHTPAAASASPAAHGVTDYTSPDFSQPSDFGQLADSTCSQSLFNNQFDFSAADPALFSDSQLQPSDQTAFPDFNNNFDADAAAAFEDSLNGGVFLNNSYIDPSLTDAGNFDPALSSQSFLEQMNSSTQLPPPPHILGSNVHSDSLSPSNSPANANLSSYASPPSNHSRQQSLDPSSAAFPQAHLGDWAGSAQFQGHRRTLSDAPSDVSSAQHSPFNQVLDDFNNPLGHSPHLQAAADPVMFQDFGIGGVSLSEAQAAYITPSHSPHISPSISPNHNAMSAFPVIDNINLGGPLGTTANFYDQANMQGLPLQGPALDFANFTTFNEDHTGKADTMSPPEINIQLAPPSRQASFEPPVKDMGASGGLTLPEKQRGRAKSDPSARGSSSSKDVLSPHSAGVGSRSPSPNNKSRRSSTSSVPPRDYILDLADPDRPTGNSNDSSGAARRTQKHPANFQCNLCPKRFTRAYNLRSHLRTHTDERPFVCNHCGKAFARQHDRKRHEGLHSGEKKFECRGALKDGDSWGCGRRFARADALGRHFRSEAGRICIKPLMDEEARERSHDQFSTDTKLGVPLMPMPNQPLALDQKNQPPPAYSLAANPAVFAPGGMPAAMPQQFPMRLPTALLEQYPTLQGIWDALPVGGADEPEDVLSGRSSFDASSAGEFDDEEEQGWGKSESRAAFGWASDVGP